MARRKLEERDIRKLIRTGSEGRSVAVTIPVEYIRELGWREGQKVRVKRSGLRIVIEDFK